jgi:hypothetical protein
MEEYVDRRFRRARDGCGHSLRGDCWWVVLDLGGVVYQEKMAVREESWGWDSGKVPECLSECL